MPFMGRPATQRSDTCPTVTAGTGHATIPCAPRRSRPGRCRAARGRQRSSRAFRRPNARRRIPALRAPAGRRTSSCPRRCPRCRPSGAARRGRARASRRCPVRPERRPRPRRPGPGPAGVGTPPGGRIDLRHANMPQSWTGGGAMPAHPGGVPGFTGSTNQATNRRSPGMIDHDEPGSADQWAWAPPSRPSPRC